MRRSTRLILALWFCLAAIALPTRAHEVRPAYLEITEVAGQRFDVLWKQPAMGEMAVRLVPRLSNGWLETEPSAIEASPGFVLKRWQGLPGGAKGLEGQTLTVEGLERTITDVMVNIHLADGQRVQQILKPQSPSLILHFRHPGSLAVSAYLQLGIEHILTGFDHLMFVLGLLLLVEGRWRLVKTITAFTVAHSITLAATALGLVQVRPAVVESLVALSIVFLATELVHAWQGRRGLTVRYPWIIAFTFGLLHGFAFASALADIGLPPGDIPLSLFLFNVGVEIGQLIFVVAALALIWLLHRLPRRLPQWTRWLPPYAIGSCSAFWFIERIVVVFT